MFSNVSNKFKSKWYNNVQELTDFVLQKICGDT